MAALRDALVLISTLLLTLGCCNGQFTDAQKKELLDKHNEGRRLQNAADMNEVAWHDGLASEGQRIAETCKDGHVTVTVAGIKTVGQNLYYKSGASNPVNAYDSWYGEGQSYNKDTHTCNSGAVCGHYRTVVLNSLTKVGCGFKVCSSFTKTDESTISDVTYVVCHYDDAPLGGEGHAVFTAGNPCTRCQSGKFWCNNNLCRTTCTAAGSNCECYAKYDGACANCGTANEADCTCKCADGYLEKYCTEKCEDILPLTNDSREACTADVRDDAEYNCVGEEGDKYPHIRERTCRATCAPYSKLCVPLTPARETAATTGCKQTKLKASVSTTTTTTTTVAPSDPCKHLKCANGERVTVGDVCKCECDAKWQGASCNVTVSGGQTSNLNMPLCVGLQILLISCTILHDSLA